MEKTDSKREKKAQKLLIQNPEPQKQVCIVSGFKGGIGKSQYAAVLVDFLLLKQLISVLIEFDTVNPDVHRKYHKKVATKLGVFSDDPNKENAANVLLNAGLEGNVVANFPAQIFTQFKNWMVKNGIAELCQEFGIEFVNFHVSDGNKDSLGIFCRSIETFPQMTHVFVKNWGMRTNEWHDFESHGGVQQYITERNIPVIDFPKFHGVSTLQKIDKLDLSFSEALTHEELEIIERSRVKQFLSKAHFNLEQSGLF